MLVSIYNKYRSKRSKTLTLPSFYMWSVITIAWFEKFETEICYVSKVSFDCSFDIQYIPLSKGRLYITSKRGVVIKMYNY